jgi:hypothetical protein
VLYRLQHKQDYQEPQPLETHQQKPNNNQPQLSHNYPGNARNGPHVTMYFEKPVPQRTGEALSFESTPIRPMLALSTPAPPRHSNRKSDSFDQQRIRLLIAGARSSLIAASRRQQGQGRPVE